MIHVAGPTDLLWTVAVGMGFAVLIVVIILLNLLLKSVRALDTRVDHVWLTAAGVHGNTSTVGPQLGHAERQLAGAVAALAPSAAPSAPRFRPSAPRFQPSAPRFQPSAPRSSVPVFRPPAPSAQPSPGDRPGTFRSPWRQR